MYYLILIIQLDPTTTTTTNDAVNTSISTGIKWKGANKDQNGVEELNIKLKSIANAELPIMWGPGSNFCKIFATREKYAAAEDRTKGGFLIQSICKTFDSDVTNITLPDLIIRIRTRTKKLATTYSKNRKKNFTQTVEDGGTLFYSIKFAPHQGPH